MNHRRSTNWLGATIPIVSIFWICAAFAQDGSFKLSANDKPPPSVSSQDTPTKEGDRQSEEKDGPPALVLGGKLDDKAQGEKAARASVPSHWREYIVDANRRVSNHFSKQTAFQNRDMRLNVALWLDAKGNVIRTEQLDKSGKPVGNAERFVFPPGLVLQPPLADMPMPIIVGIMTTRTGIHGGNSIGGR